MDFARYFRQLRAALAGPLYRRDCCGKCNGLAIFGGVGLWLCQRIVAVHSGVGVVVASVSRRAVSTAHGFYVNGLGETLAMAKPWRRSRTTRGRIFSFICAGQTNMRWKVGRLLCCLQCLLGSAGGSAYGCCPDSPSGDANKVCHHVSMGECVIPERLLGGLYRARVAGGNRSLSG